jgi:hypothetical protein
MLPFLHGVYRRAGEGLRVDVPLLGQEGFDHDAAAITARHLEAMFVDAFQQSEVAQVLDDTLPRLKRSIPR